MSDVFASFVILIRRDFSNDDDDFLLNRGADRFGLFHSDDGDD